MTGGVRFSLPVQAADAAALHYTLLGNGDLWDGTHYYLADGTMVRNAFFCDGTYTYYLQADGSPMKDRLTYHPDGEHVIYFDNDGHEVFSDFSHISRSISGNAVDDMCFFDVNGYMYVDTLTYDKTGTVLYYVNPYGVLERSGWFSFSGHEFDAGLGFSGKSGGYGYANADCSLLVNTAAYDWNNNLVYLEADGHVAGSQTGASTSLPAEDTSTSSSLTKCSVSTTQIADFGYWLYTPANATDRISSRRKRQGK